MSLPHTARSIAAATALMAIAIAGPAPARADTSTTASVDGQAWDFGNYGVLRGSRVFVLEDPSLAGTVDDDGRWRIDGIPVGASVTFAVREQGRYPIQTATFTMPAGGLDHVTIQSPTDDLVGALATVAGEALDPGACRIASTVTRQGYSLFAGAPDGTHGEPGATAHLDPEPPGGATAVYFNLSRYDVIWPDPALTATTADGGVVFANVAPGTYTLRAEKPGATVAPVTIRCIAGTLTNASPPKGLQVTAGGLPPGVTVPITSPATTTTSAPTTTAGSAPDAPTATTAAPSTPAAAPGAVPVAGPVTYTG